MDRVRWGILGAAKIAQEWVAPAIHIERPRRGRGGGEPHARARPRRWPRPTGRGSLASYEALLADPAIDAVYVPLPNVAHVEWTAKCLEAGKHVLCEKPIALRAEEIDRADRAARPHRLRGGGGVHGHAPSAVAAGCASWSRDGAIGRLRQVQGGVQLHAARRRQHPQRRRPGRRRAARHRGLSVRHHPLRHRRGAGRDRPCRDRLGPRASTRPRGCWRRSRTSSSTSTSRCAWRRASRWPSTARRARSWSGRRSTPAPTPTRWSSCATPTDGWCSSASARADQYRAQIDAFNAAVLDGAAYRLPAGILARQPGDDRHDLRRRRPGAGVSAL